VARDPMLPTLFEVARFRRELNDVFTLELTPPAGAFPFQAGQFNMLYPFGVGEAPISISGDPDRPERLLHTIRAVGAVTEALGRLRPGDGVGVRGPFGSAWPVAEVEGMDVVFVAGGIGLAPLRPAIHQVLANRTRYGRVVILYGARSPGEILYRAELERWSGRLDTYVDVTVDRASPGWAGNVGVVTRLIERARFDAPNTAAFLCGPEIMMRFTVEALNSAGVEDRRIHASMERNMKCAVGFCGHCQFGASFVCKDGPVFRFDRIRSRFNVREL